MGTSGGRGNLSGPQEDKNEAELTINITAIQNPLFPPRASSGRTLINLLIPIKQSFGFGFVFNGLLDADRTWNTESDHETSKNVHNNRGVPVVSQLEDKFVKWLSN